MTRQPIELFSPTEQILADDQPPGSTETDGSTVAPRGITLMPEISHGNDGDFTPGIEPEVQEMLKARKKIIREEKNQKIIAMLLHMGLIDKELGQKLKSSQVDFSNPPDQLGTALLKFINEEQVDNLLAAIKQVSGELGPGKDDPSHKSKVAKPSPDEGEDKKPAKKKSIIQEAMEKLGLLEKNAPTLAATPQVEKAHNLVKGEAKAMGNQLPDAAEIVDKLLGSRAVMEMAALTQDVRNNAIRDVQVAIDQGAAPSTEQANSVALLAIIPPVIVETPPPAGHEAPAQDAAPAITKRESALNVLLGGYKLTTLALPDAGTNLVKPDDSPTVMTDAVRKDREAPAPVRTPPSATG